MSGGCSDLMKDDAIGKKINKISDVLIKFLATGSTEAYDTLKMITNKYLDQNTTGYWRSGPRNVAVFVNENYLSRENPSVKREDIELLIGNLSGDIRMRTLGLLFTTHENPDALDVENILESKYRYKRLKDGESYNKWMKRLYDFIENHDFGCLDGTLSMNEIERFMNFYDIDVWYETDKELK